PPPDFVNNCRLGKYDFKVDSFGRKYIDEVRFSYWKDILKVAGGSDLRIGRMIVDTPGVIDFEGNGHVSYLYIDEVIFKGSSYVTFIDHSPGSAVWVRDFGQDMDDLIRHFNNKQYGVLYKDSYSRFNREWYALLASNVPWTPIPEPTTCGAIVSATALGLALISRRRRKRESATHGPCCNAARAVSGVRVNGAC
ncbi:hypothetical protein, partial [Cephaloticoccus primus]|uniref:hypothetical protein n=1 Tax=Cephaloticoccus primus TaxID=1548207 RepID=UPI0018D3FE1B